MENMILKFNFDNFYGLYTKQLRKFYEIKQIEMANALHVSRSALSKMESNSQEMDAALFDSVLSFIKTIDSNFVFLKDPSILKEYDKWVRDCAYHFVHLTAENILGPLKEFVERTNPHSFAFFHHQLLAVYVAKFENRKCEEEVTQLYEGNFFEDPFYQAVLNDFMGMRPSLSDGRSLDEAIQYLRSAQNYCSMAFDPGLSGLILYHQIYRFVNGSRTIEAYEIIERCENALQRAGAYRRMLYVALNKGILFIQMHLYPKAIATFEELLRSSQQINEPDFIQTIYDNLAWCCFLQDQDEKALRYARLARKAGSRFPDIYIVLAFSSYRLKRQRDCLGFISMYLKKTQGSPREKFIASFLQLLRFHLTGNSRFDKKQHQIEQQLQNFKSVQLEIPFYTLLIQHYSEQGRSDCVIAYQAKLIHYLKFDF